MPQNQAKFPLTPAEYERVAERIIDLSSTQANLEKHGCGLRNKIEGWSGHRHQINVSFVVKTLKALFLIECKQWIKKVRLEDVLVFHSRIRDIGKQRKQDPLEMMVTTIGYERAAKKYADKYSIRLNKVKDDAEFAIVFPKIGNVFHVAIGERQHVVG